MFDSDWINPKSMLTPGIAGTISMVVGNGLWIGFGLPPEWVALGASFLIVLLILAEYQVVLWKKMGYILINSLFVFSISLGMNQSLKYGSSVVSEKRYNNAPLQIHENQVPTDQSKSRDFFTNWFEPKSLSVNN